MTKYLEGYLKEVNSYLYMNDEKEKEDIIKEIQCCIQDEVSHLYGEETEESVKKVIQKFGSPKEIARKYMCEIEESSLPYQKFFFLIFGVLFVITASIYMCLIVSGASGFTSLKSYSDTKQLFLRILSIGVVVIIDLGLLVPVAIALGKKKGTYNVASIEASSKKNTRFADIIFSRTQTKRKNVIQLLVSIIVLIVLGLLYGRYQTLFLISQTNGKEILKADNVVCQGFSLIIIAVTVMHVIYYGVNLLRKKVTEGIVLSYTRFVLLWGVLNVMRFYQEYDTSFHEAFKNMTYMNTIFIIAIVIFALDAIRKSIGASIKYRLKKE